MRAANAINSPFIRLDRGLLTLPDGAWQPRGKLPRELPFDLISWSLWAFGEKITRLVGLPSGLVVFGFQGLWEGERDNNAYGTRKRWFVNKESSREDDSLCVKSQNQTYRRAKGGEEE